MLLQRKKGYILPESAPLLRQKDHRKKFNMKLKTTMHEMNYTQHPSNISKIATTGWTTRKRIIPVIYEQVQVGTYQVED